MIKILYIEDEAALAKIVKESLQSRSFEVLHLDKPENLDQSLTDFKPDICLLDIMLPQRDGFEIAKEIRIKYPKLPIIFITAKNQTADVLNGFNVGGNDYIKKPFSLEELIVRINNLCSLTGNKPDAVNLRPEINIGKYVFAEQKLTLVFGNEVRRLSYREGQLLSMLGAQKNEVVSRKLILDTLWGDDHFFNSRNLDVYITKLRQYLKQDTSVQILTLKSVGYRLIEG